jgi:alpha-N-arabinofuranosidase
MTPYFATFAVLAAVLIMHAPAAQAQDKPAAPPSAQQAAPAGDDEPRALVTIAPAAAPKAYSGMIFGGFIEHFDSQVYGGLFQPGSKLSDERGFRKDVIAAMKELKLSVVRWPGGCFASGYHWKDGVGKKRKPVPDPVWGVTDNNTFGTDEFVAWCRLVGCEPYICTNAGNGTPEEMAHWVEYCNAENGEYAAMRKAGGHAEPLNVPIWSIGNENWGGHEIGAKTPRQWGPLVLRSAELMRSVDPRIKLAAAATPDRDWTVPLLQAAGKHLDYVAVHNYWFGLHGRNDMPDYLTCIMRSEGPEKMIAGVVAILADTGFRGRIKIAFDEWNLRGWHHPGFPRKQPVDPNDKAAAELVARREDNAIAKQYTMADALFAASFLNACLRHCEDVGMANIAPIINTRGPLYVHPEGIVKRTTFHALAMYANLLESRVGKLQVEASPLVQGKGSIPVVDATATCDESGGKWAIALINRHPEKTAACTVRIGNLLPDGQYDATVLAGDSPEAYNDVEHPHRVAPEQKKVALARGVVNLPPHSLMVVHIAAK